MENLQFVEDQERFKMEWPEAWWEMLRNPHTNANE